MADAVLLCLMLACFLKERFEDAGGVWRMLVRQASLRMLWMYIFRGSMRRRFEQGIIWVMLATLVEVPPMVFLFLDLNGPSIQVRESSDSIVSVLVN